MFRRLMTSLILLLVLPAFAHAWYVNAKTSPTTGQGTISPAGNKYYATGTSSLPYTVTPAAGYKVARVTIDGVAATPVNGTYTVPYSGKFWRYIVAYYTANTVSITTSVGPNGGIREDSNESLTNIAAGSTRTLLIAPAFGYEIDTYSAANATSNELDPFTGVRTVTFENLQADQSVSATFKMTPVVTVNAGADVSTTGDAAEYAATLSGSATSNQGAAAYAWSGAGLVFGTPNAAQTTVYSTTPGIYIATLSVTSGTVTVADTAQVTVISRVQYVENQCSSCHASRTPWVLAAYDESSHKSTTHGVVSCEACHDPNDVTTHHEIDAPYGAGTAEGCQQCHKSYAAGEQYPGSPASNYSIYDDNSFTTMRTPHGAGTVLLQAQFVAQNTSCADCHANHNNKINGEYGESGHGNVNGEAWWHYDWADPGLPGQPWTSRQPCQPCHTTTGFINKLTGSTTPLATGQVAQVLSCNGCHSDVGSGAVRPAAAFVDGTKIAIPELSTSNLCARCHSGRESGLSIVNSTADFSNASFINSHYLAAAGVLTSATGYEYAGRTYAEGFHAGVGIDNAFNTGEAGPCVSCHMSSGEKGHTFEVVTHDTVTGAINAVTSTECAKCHAERMTPAKLEASKAVITNALHQLDLALQAKGIYFQPAYPYFYQADLSTPFKDWTLAGTMNGKDVMGAAFNYNLLEHDPGAYAHNRMYTLQLIADSIDFLNNGMFDGDSGIPAINDSEPHVPELAEMTGDPILDAANCSACHTAAPHYGGAVTVQSQYVTTGSTCADCHFGGVPKNDQPIQSEYAESGHGDVNGEAWMHYDWSLASRAACQQCHSTTGIINKLTGSTTAVAPMEVLSCKGCHTSVDTGEVRPAPAYVNGTKIAMPNYGKSNLCATCHSGRESMASLDAVTDFTNASFVNSHYFAAAGVLSAGTGFEYDFDADPLTDNYANVAYFAHNKVGIADPANVTATDSGPCAGCHMESGGHTWEIVKRDDSGVISEVSAALCNTCHHDAYTVTPELMEHESHGYHAALAALEDALKAKGIYFQPRYPYFFNGTESTATAIKNWTVGATMDGKSVMGAAFNYNLLHHEPGAYAHNRYYTKKLIFDSLNFLDNGNVQDLTIDLSANIDAAAYLKSTAPANAVTRP